jgi:NAD(P)-dependent dehydrogenase (short-subunit alcohol dehydrogenase family)
LPRLANKTAIITGAGSGIGRACAAAFAREGAQVVLVGRRHDSLASTAKQMAGEKLVLSADITRPADIERIMAATLQQFGRIHILVNNAGVLFTGSAEALSEEQWDQMFETNVKAVWRLSRSVLPHLRVAGGGSIVNISSVLGLVGAPNRAGYAASKGAVTLLTKAMALDHATEHIRVNCICPAVVETEMIHSFITNQPDPEAARAQRVAMHPVRRFGKAEEVAELAVYLASDEAAFVTGAAFPVDGGYTAA